jgi:hypothetical protein
VAAGAVVGALDVAHEIVNDVADRASRLHKKKQNEFSNRGGGQGTFDCETCLTVTAHERLV